jgi:regulatory protein
MSEANSKVKARKKAMDLLARREHSEQELRQKLETREYDADEIEDALHALKSDGLQSDLRFSESYVNHRVNAGLGPTKIRSELRQKGISDELADEFLGPFSDCWEAMMREQRVKKFGEDIPDDYNARMKQARFLQNRGFSPESVMRLFR